MIREFRDWQTGLDEKTIRVVGAVEYGERHEYDADNKKGCSSTGWTGKEIWGEKAKNERDNDMKKVTEWWTEKIKLDSSEADDTILNRPRGVKIRDLCRNVKQ